MSVSSEQQLAFRSTAPIHLPCYAWKDAGASGSDLVFCFLAGQRTTRACCRCVCHAGPTVTAANTAACGDSGSDPSMLVRPCHAPLCTLGRIATNRGGHVLQTAQPPAIRWHAPASRRVHPGAWQARGQAPRLAISPPSPAHACGLRLNEVARGGTPRLAVAKGDRVGLGALPDGRGSGFCAPPPQAGRFCEVAKKGIDA